MWCYADVIWSQSFSKPNYGNVMACSMMCVVYWLLLLYSLPMWSWGVCIWDTWLNHFWVIDQLYLDYFPLALMGLKCWFILDDVMLWHVLTWPFWESSISIILRCFWLLVENQWILWFILRYLTVAHWEPMGVVIYHWYGYWDLF